VFGRGVLTVACAIALMTGLGGCAGTEPREPVTAELVGVEPQGGGLVSRTLALDVRVTNPNDTDVPLSGLTAKLALNGKPFASGVSDRAVTVPALSDRVITVQATAGALNMLRQVLVTASSETFSYELTGIAHGADSLGDRRMTFADSGRFSLADGDGWQRP